MTRRGRGEVLRERTPLTLRPDGDGPEAAVAGISSTEPNRPRSCVSTEAVASRSIR